MNTINLKTLGRDIISHKEPIKDWKHLEDIVLHACLHQHPKAEQNGDLYPDIVLPSIGFEIKMVQGNHNDRINLNSSPPGKHNIYYVFAHVGYRSDQCHYGEISDVAIVHTSQYGSGDIDEILQHKIETQIAENNRLFWRTRVVFEVESPFKIWGDGHYIIDSEGNKTVF